MVKILQDPVGVTKLSVARYQSKTGDRMGIAALIEIKGTGTVTIQGILDKSKVLGFAMNPPES